MYTGGTDKEIRSARTLNARTSVRAFCGINVEKTGRHGIIKARYV